MMHVHVIDFFKIMQYQLCTTEHNLHILHVIHQLISLKRNLLYI